MYYVSNDCRPTIGLIAYLVMIKIVNYVISNKSTTNMADNKLSQKHLIAALATDFRISKEDVQNVEWTECAGAGLMDGFTTEVVAVRGQAKIANKNHVNFSYIVKLTPEVGYRADLVKDMGIMEKEYLFYVEILEQANEKRRKLRLKSLAVPKCLFGLPDPGVLIMNNLKDLGYDLVKNQTGSKMRGLQDEDLTLFLQALASFHASTYQIIQESGGQEAFLQKYTTLANNLPLNQEFETMFKTEFNNSCENFALIAKDFIDETTSEKILKFKKKVWSCFEKGFYQPYGDFQTIIHGDSWVNNAMFRFEGDRAVEIAMLDFQCVRMTSPAVDLVHLIVTGTRPDLRTKLERDWLKIYFEQFSQDLEAFGYSADKVYPFEKLVEDYDGIYDYGFTWCLMHIGALMDNIEGQFKDTPSMTNDESVEYMEAQKFKLYEQTKVNLQFRERVIGLLKEAMSKNVIV